MSHEPAQDRPHIHDYAHGDHAGDAPPPAPADAPVPTATPSLSPSRSSSPASSSSRSGHGSTVPFDPPHAPTIAAPGDAEAAAIAADVNGRRRKARHPFHSRRPGTTGTTGAGDAGGPGGKPHRVGHVGRVADETDERSRRAVLSSTRPGDAAGSGADGQTGAERNAERESVMSGPSVAGGEDEAERASMLDGDDDGAGRAFGDEPLEHVQTHALEEYAKTRREPVQVLEHGGAADLDRPVDRGPQEYVWDVMFENQRGIHIFGKAYFSSRSLLPSDPSPFTVPAYPLIGASSLAIAGPSEAAGPDAPPGRRAGSRAMPPASAAARPDSHTPDAPVAARRTRTRRQAKIDTRPPAPPASRRPIRTAYDLQTAQVPSPAWTWLTPWMVNMREGTDDGGWRYNYVFRKRGWGAHAGGLGWGGWCRRREWVRLRGKLAEVEERVPARAVERREGGRGDGENTGGGDEHEKRTGTPEPPLPVDGDVDVELALARVVKAMGTVVLDRERLAIWASWLARADGPAAAKLRDVLDQSAPDVLRAFTYASSRQRFAELLGAHGMPAPPARPF